MHHTEDFLKIVGFIGLGILIGWLLWHPVNNDYVTKQDYKAVLMENQKLSDENTKLKQDMANLIKEFYTKKAIFDMVGINRHRAVFCALQSYLDTQIPIIGELVC